jgi:TatD DNase family protein
MLVDAHCHLQDRQFDGDRDEALDRARAAGVSAFVVVGTDLQSSLLAVDLADSHSDVYATVGFHPHDAKDLDDRALGAIQRLALHSPKVVAIGEIGLDFYRMLSPRDAQLAAFRAQLDLARRLSLPVVVHSREADAETYDIIAAYEERALPDWPKDRPLGMMHCFAGDLTLALRYVQLGFMLSISATCTYPNADRVCAVAGGLPLRWMTVETDAPYLPPQARRGQRNEPAYLPETVARIAELRGDTIDEVATATAQATAWLLGLGDIEGVPASRRQETPK